MLQRLRNEERGWAAVIFVAFAGTLMALAALGADVGLLVTRRHQLNATADMAALSGGQLLPEDPRSAVATARRILTDHGFDGQAAIIEVLPDNRTLRVALETDRATAFARIFGVAQATVGTGVQTRTDNLSGVTGAIPLGIAQGDFVLGQSVTLRGTANNDSVGPGNFQALAFDPNARGASEYRRHLRDGYQGWIRIGEWIHTEPGVAAGPTREEIKARIEADPYATWQTVRRGSPRLILVPMLEDWAVNGRDEVLVVGFAVFFLEATNINAGQVSVRGRFLRYVVEGEGSQDAPDFGARTVKLKG